MKKKVLVFGLGQSCRNQPDIAVRVIEYLRNRSNDNNLELIDSTSCKKNLAECIESAEQMIVIDINSDKINPGAVKVYEGFEMDAFIRHRQTRDSQNTALRDAMKNATLKGKLPSHRALVGIDAIQSAQDSAEPENNTAVIRACQKIFEITECWKI